MSILKLQKANKTCEVKMKKIDDTSGENYAKKRSITKLPPEKISQGENNRKEMKEIYINIGQSAC